MSEIKVTDRRMFTPDGRLREEFERELSAPRPAVVAESKPEEPPVPEPATPPGAAVATPSSETSPAGETGASGGLPPSAPAAPPPGLLELVEFLSGWSLACLGEVPQPDGRLARDLDAARFYIDLIGAFHERWGQSLGAEERRFIEGYLDQLRLRYVSHRG